MCGFDCNIWSKFDTVVDTQENKKLEAINFLAENYPKKYVVHNNELKRRLGILRRGQCKKCKKETNFLQLEDKSWYSSILCLECYNDATGSELIIPICTESLIDELEEILYILKKRR